MSKSVYFPQYGGVTTEQKLVQDLVDEQIKLFGMDVFYIPREILKDKSLNDVVLSKYKQYYMIEMMLLNVEGFGGVSSLEMSKFGLKIMDELSFAVSKRKWQTFASTSIKSTVQSRPNEGDLIYVPMTKNTYEIKYVEREVPFYQLGKNYVYAMNCELFQNADSEFDTGIDEIDNLSKESYVFPVVFKDGGTGSFVEGEVITQTYTKNGQPVTVSGRVSKWNLPSKTLDVVYNDGEFKQNLPIVGQESGASWVVDTLSTIDFNLENYDYAENKYYEDTADLIIDFSEGNPFGEFGDMGVF